MHNQENAASQICREQFGTYLSLHLVYNRRRVPPPQQTLRTRLPGEMSWSNDASSSLWWVRRKVQRTYRLVWASLFLYSFSFWVYLRIWTALNCGVHSADFMYLEFKNGQQGKDSGSMIKGAWLHGVKETRVVKLFNKYYYGINVTQPNPGAFKLCCKERVCSRSGNHPKFGNTSKNASRSRRLT